VAGIPVLVKKKLVVLRHFGDQIMFLEQELEDIMVIALILLMVL
jgi:hypothetical protein